MFDSDVEIVLCRGCVGSRLQWHRISPDWLCPVRRVVGLLTDAERLRRLHTTGRHRLLRTVSGRRCSRVPG